MSFDCEVVGKIGSTALINRETNEMDYNIIKRIGKFLYPGCVWISSGAVEIGKIDYYKRNNSRIAAEDNITKSLYASQGQCVLIENYRRFIKQEYSVRQILIEHNHFNDLKKREYVKRLLLGSIKQKAIPIINYNDSVSSDKIMKMEIDDIRNRNISAVECVDNDETASQVSVLLRSKYLIIMTATKGLLERPEDPTSLIERVEGKDTYELLENINNLLHHCDGTSREGSNGMIAKLQYIQEPIKNDTVVIIGSPKYAIPDLINGNVRRTIFKVR